MARGGRAWRGYFRVGDELTSGQPDQKEGLYFGAELPADDPRVLAGTPLHGPNLFPRQAPGCGRGARLHGRADRPGPGLMAGLALSLGLEESYFATGYTADPMILFRIFNYPPPAAPTVWGVGEHTDYGLLTLLAQDDAGGLEVVALGVGRRPAGAGLVRLQHRRHARPDDRRLYRSTPHRVRNPAAATGSRSRSSSTRASSPRCRRCRTAPPPDDGRRRWDGQRPRVHGDLRRLPPRQGRQGLPAAPQRRTGLGPGSVRARPGGWARPARRLCPARPGPTR